MTTSETGRANPPLSISDEECRRLLGVMEVVGRRWASGILLALGTGAERFTEIEHRVQGLSGRMLTLRLRELEAAGLVERLVEPTIPVSVRYRLSARGIDLLRSLQPIAGYARRWETDDAGEAVSAKSA
ncbi:helix-turn-helix domain-containing protein [Arthrobacter jinronghuae]|uniref:Helix-turn-helix transcriptional regulator n=1 Tax=Arthrobacter jinronghuae TaxID=2964609 RepID=A0ABT1NM39_9MICC|nr:helix-turn-helix domain-containing protein [Arthrobacter jinronghuae]MCQ1948766.1 helix-turn-helix transcriptional regulator [Arthrobacter jinronghuae]MCQ1952092.1 helix-turn-helix transcriptional regulator [Arthrobacter sp. zg-Y238]UWX78422.1 helix-turn-helix transcriptional regulator [Arthrobacter jinronghuae]